MSVMDYSVVYMGNSEYDNSKMDMLLSKYPMVNKQWKYVGGGDTIRWSLGDVVKNMYSDVYEGLSIQKSSRSMNKNVVCSVDVTSIEGSMIYCLDVIEHIK